MSRKEKNISKKKLSKKKLTKEEKEKKEEKEIRKLDDQLFEIDTEIKKVALNNKKIILEEWEESKGLTSHIRETGLENENFSPSLEMINAPQRSLVPLERTLQLSTQAPNILGNNNENKNEEFNPFKYNAGNNNGPDSNSPKYTSYESGGGVKKIDIAEESRRTPESIVHTKSVGFNPMYESEKKSIENYVPVKVTEDPSSFGRKKQERTELKYTPGGY